MTGEKLRIQQGKAPHPQARHEMNQCNFGGITDAAEHAFAKKSTTQTYTIETADQALPLPALDGMSQTRCMQILIAFQDRGIDPGAGTIVSCLATCLHYGGKIAVDMHGKPVRTDDLGQRSGHMKMIQRDNAALFRFDPENFFILGAVSHREDTGRIGADQQISRKMLHGCAKK